ncbi:MAP/microtubule affinity-regulating kinase 3, partial [Biomphalaria pfeifferi]
GTLKDFIASIGKLQEKQVKRIAKQLLEGVEYLHKKRILHRDLKSRNILMSDDENIKIADFGISKQFQTFSVAETYTGTIKYMAPEMFTGAKYSYPVDI